MPTDIVFQVLIGRLRYKMSLRDVAEFFLLRGFEFTHETVRHWEERFAPLIAEQGVLVVMEPDFALRVFQQQIDNFY